VALNNVCSSAGGLVNNVIFFGFVWGGVVCGFPLAFGGLRRFYNVILGGETGAV
jgi:hypothetical protein